MIHKFGWLFRIIYPHFEWLRPLDFENTVYLTFDDGPVPEATDFVLQTLKKYNVKATFFCVGDNIKKHPDIFNKVVSDGHTCGNHTYNHLNGRKNDTHTYIENIRKCQELLPEISGKPLFRPPYGRLKKNQIKLIQKNYRIIMWDVLTQDYNASLEKEKCLKSAIKATENGSIVLFHDSMKAYDNLRYVLPRYIEKTLSLGYQFKTL